MVAAKIDLIKGSEPTTGQVVDLQIEQGTTYKLVLSISGDRTSGTFRGQVRTDYVDNEGSTVLATLSFSSVTYDPTVTTNFPNGKTTFIVTIPDTVTDTMPETKNIGTTKKSIPNTGHYVYDIEYDDGSEVSRDFEGLVQVTPQSTGA